MATTYTLDEPAAPSFKLDEPAEKPKTPDWLSRAASVMPYGVGLLEQASRGATVGAGRGALRGARDIVDVGAEGLATVYDKAATALTGVSRQSQSDMIAGRPGGQLGKIKAQNEADLAEYDAQNNGIPGALGRFGAQALITAPIGGLVAVPLRALATSKYAAPLIGRAAPYITALADSITSGGMKTGMQAEAAREGARETAKAAAKAATLEAAGQPVPAALAAAAANPVAAATTGQKVADVAMRIAGGGISGLATGGATEGVHGMPTAAAFGAALPPVFRGVGAAANAGYRAAAPILKPQIARDAESIMRAGGYTADDIPALRGALEQRGPTIVQAVRPEGGGASTLTTAQVLQNPGISQFARTLNNVDNVGTSPLHAADEMQRAAQVRALDRLGPTHGTVNDTRDAFGAVAQPGIVGADAKARDTTSRAFKAIDPAADARLLLPIGKMEADAAEFLDPQIFGDTAAAQAIQKAKAIGTETIEPVGSVSAGAAKPKQTLAQLVRSMGGIDAWTPTGERLAGELADLRQTNGMRGIVRDGSGRSPEKMAEELHQLGHIPDEDPVTLLNHLRDPDLSGTAIHADDQERVWSALREAGQGDAPTAAVTIDKPVTFKQAQSLRQFIGEQSRKAGEAKEDSLKAALNAQRAALDAKVADVAGGNVGPGEYFPVDMQEQWKKARDLKKLQVDTFRTGPQAGLFRDGSDNLPVLNGGELAPAFFNKSADQSGNIASFGKVATPQTSQLLKNYAVRSAFDTHNAKGQLTSKFGDYLDDYSGAIGGLFDRGEQAQLRAVASNVKTAADTLTQGMGPNSASVKNLGALSAFGEAAPVAEAAGRFAVGQLPIIGRPITMMGEHFAKGAKASEIGRLSHLMADPAQLEAALRQLQLSGAQVPLGLSPSALNAATYSTRGASLLGGQL